jgi:hypothetical protein
VPSGPFRRPVALGSALAVVALASAVLLAGCTPAPAASPAPARTASTAPSPTPTASPTIDLDGNASENLPYFDAVNKALIAKGGTLDGRAFIDNLVAAGYPKNAMEVTPDKTSVNLDADNIEFSVLLGRTCLIGEYGNIGYASTAQKVFSTGRCLAGKTRKIDW